MANAEDFLSKFGGSRADAEQAPEAVPEGSLGSFLERFGPKLSDSYFFYNNTVQLRFDPESWTYFLVGPLGELTPQYGVTSVIRVIDKSQMLVPWAAKVCIEKLLRTIPTKADAEGNIVVPEMSLGDFTKLALEAKNAHREKLEDAGLVGHQAHQCLEDSIKATLAGDGVVRELVNLPTEERAVSCANAAKNWMDKHATKWLHTEKKIFSLSWGYAGTTDGLATCSACQDKACCAEQFTNALVLIDWKTSNALRLEYILQVGSYRAAYCEEHGTPIDRGVILRLGKENGEFESLPLNAEELDAGFVGFLACLDLLKATTKVDELWKTQKSQRKTAEKDARADAKAQEKATKAAQKAEARILKEEEKRRIKADAKDARADAKAWNV